MTKQPEKYKRIGKVIDKKYRENSFEKFMAMRESMYRELYQKNSKYRDAFGKLYRLEFEGGKCWMCNREWKPIRIDNDYADGGYFIPQCDCFVKCPECKSQLYDKQFIYNNKLQRCDNCGFLLFNEATKTKRHGKEFEDYYNALPLNDRMRERCER